MAKKSGGDKAIMDIDLSQLEVEWQGQAPMYEQASRQLADAQKAHAELEIDLVVKRAEVAKKVRDSPEDYGLEKVTEAGVKESVDSDKRVVGIRKKIVEAKYLIDLLVGKCRALEHRKRALEKEVDLFLAGYFAAPRERRAKMSPSGGVRMPKGVKGRKRSGEEDDDED